MFSRIVAAAAAAALVLAHSGTPSQAASISGASNTGNFVDTCLNVNAGAPTASGFLVINYPCGGNAFNEGWAMSGFQLLGVGTSAPNTAATCLSVTGGSTTAGATVELDACVAGAANQAWQYTQGEIVAYVTGYCLDRTKSRVGNAVVVNPCSGVPSQFWVVR